MTMNPKNILRLLFITILAVLPCAGRATVFFSDTFTNGSTIISTSPAAPTATNTAYQMISAKNWVPNPPTLNAGGLRFGIGASSSGVLEIQALFATNPIALVLPGDYIQLTIVFTNVSGILTASGQMGIGLYNSGGVSPLPGGTNLATTGITLTGYAQNWLGYMSIVGYPGTDSSRVFTRPAQTITTGNNQDLIANGSSSSAYQSAATISGTYGGVALTAGSTYTEVFTITLVDATTLGITNTLYSGAGTGGTVLTNYGGTATGANLLTAGFDAFGFGYRSRNGTSANLINLSSVEVSGSVTAVSGPPTIDAQPVSVSVATNGSCMFKVAATGFNVAYQWRRNGANLSNGGNISGATSSMLVVNNANVADEFSGANGYYCVVSGAGGYSTNTFTNSLSLVSAKNLVWNGTGANWDFVNTYFNDLGNGNNPTNFNYGDAVTFDDTGAGNANVTLSDSFLSASKWLITGSTAYAFGGSGYAAGAGQLIFDSSASGSIQLNVANQHSGGTIVSNSNSALIIYCSQYQVLGTGPLTLAKPGILEFVPSGSASVGIPGNMVVNDDFTVQFDASGSFAGTILGNISGTSGKTLTLTPSLAGISNTNRYRAYGTNTVCDANIAINPSGNPTSQAQYDGTVFAPYHGSGTQTYNGTISGYGGIIQRAGGTTILNAANTYSGGTTPTTGSIGLGHNNALGAGPLIIAPELPNATGSGTVFAHNGPRTIATSLVYPSGTNNQTLIIGGTNDITFTSAIDLDGADNTGNPGARTFTVNNTGATTLSGIISDSSANNLGFVKNGTGTLYLNGNNTFTGVTTNSAGRLAGTGSLAGSVVVTNAAISGGSSSAIGTLAVGGNLTFATGGGGYFRLNTGNAQTSDRVSVTGNITNNGTGTITLTNIGPALAAGNTFTLFSKGVTNGNNFVISLAGTNEHVVWNNNLAVDGTVQVQTLVASTAGPITNSVSGNTLTLSWAPEYLTWILQSNAVGLASANSWYPLSTNTSTSKALTVDPVKTNVFYRLVRPW